MTNLPHIYEGVVVQVQGKFVKAKIPAVLGVTVSNWAAPFIAATDTPVVGDVVFVMFVGGDVSRPVYGITVDARPW